MGWLVELEDGGCFELVFPFAPDGGLLGHCGSAARQAAPVLVGAAVHSLGHVGLFFVVGRSRGRTQFGFDLAGGCGES